MVALAVATAAGNTAVLTALCRLRRAPAHYPLASLAAADLLLGLVVLPVAIARELFLFHLNSIICAVWNTLDVLSCTASILSICLLCWERWGGITAPFTHARRAKRARVFAALVWPLATAVALPTAFVPSHVHYLKGEVPKACTVNTNVSYVFVSTFLSFYLPAGVMLGLYVCILRALAAPREMPMRAHCGRRPIVKDTCHSDNETNKPSSPLRDKIQKVAKFLSPKEKPLNTPSAASYRSQKQLEPPGAASNRSQKQLEPPGAASNRSQKQLEPPGAASNRSQKQLDLPGAASNRSQKQLEPPGAVSNRSQKQLEPPGAASNRSQKQLDLPGAASNRSQKQLDLPGAASNRSQKQLDLPGATSNRSQKQLEPPGAASNRTQELDCPGAASNGTKKPQDLPDAASNRTQKKLDLPGADSKRTKQKTREKQTSPDCFHSRQRRATRTIVLLMALFLICWTPFFIMLPLDSLCECVSEVTRQLCTWLGFVNSALNPLVYSAASPSVRKALRDSFTRRSRATDLSMKHYGRACFSR